MWQHTAAKESRSTEIGNSVSFARDNPVNKHPQDVRGEPKSNVSFGGDVENE